MTAAPLRANTLSSTLQIFIYLQLLDALTTLVGFRAGLEEASPFVRMLLHSGPVAGLLACKLLALLIAAACVWLARLRLIRWANYWYAGLVAWNIILILTRMPQ
jgi:hypothetical protein